MDKEHGVLYHSTDVKFRLAGCAIVPERQELLRLVKSLGIRTGFLVPDPDNEFDQDAVRVMVKLPVGPMQIGYIPNKSFTCRLCGRTYSPKRPDRCVCNSKEFRRSGTASYVSRMLRSGINYAVELSVDGGEEGKNFGCLVTLREVKS